MGFDIEKNRTLLNYCFTQHSINSNTYGKIYSYYCGGTEPSGRMFSINSNTGTDKTNITANNNLNDRTKHKVGVNMMKKFIKEEVSYSVGNKVTYQSHNGDTDIIEQIRLNLAHWDETQDSTLAKMMLTYSKAYELYYIDDDGNFSSTLISPRHGYMYYDLKGNPVLFMNFYSDEFDTSNQFIDILTNDEVIHCDSTFQEIKARENNIFGKVPVGVARLSDEDWYDTIYNDIKSLQDAFEINLTNISQEISELRNAYLWLNNISIDEKDYAELKKKGILETKGENKNINASWLVKNINDTFVQNTLDKIEDLMYKVTFHINTNEKMQSNTSSLALRTRLIGLEEKCKLNQKALANCLKTRLQMLFLWLNYKKNSNYDYRDIIIKFTPNIPQDDLMTAQVINYLGNKLSTETAISQLSFVDNPAEEVKKLHEEMEEDPLVQGKNILDKVVTSQGGEDVGNTETS